MPRREIEVHGCRSLESAFIKAREFADNLQYLCEDNEWTHVYRVKIKLARAECSHVLNGESCDIDRDIMFVFEVSTA